MTATRNSSPIGIVILTNGMLLLCMAIKLFLLQKCRYDLFVSPCKCGLVANLSFNRWKTLLSKVWVEILLNEKRFYHLKKRFKDSIMIIFYDFLCEDNLFHYIVCFPFNRLMNASTWLGKFYKRHAYVFGW